MQIWDNSQGPNSKLRDRSGAKIQTQGREDSLRTETMVLGRRMTLHIVPRDPVGQTPQPLNSFEKITIFKNIICKIFKICVPMKWAGSLKKDLISTLDFGTKWATWYQLSKKFSTR